MVKILLSLFLVLFTAYGIASTGEAKMLTSQVTIDPNGINETTPEVAHRWTFDPLSSNESKFVFTLKGTDRTHLTLTCDRKVRYVNLTFTKDGKTYSAPNFDSITAYTPNGVLRDSIILEGGPSVDKIVQFFDDTSTYYVILEHAFNGKYTLGAKASGDVGQNIEVCRGLPFKP